MPVITFLLFVLILSLLVLVHELGHFLFAKLAGVKVEEFGLGLPPKIWGFKRGETVYSINLLPIGGFVRLSGEEETKEAPNSFSRQGALTKSLVVTAGVIMNLLLGYLLVFVAFSQIGIPSVSIQLQITEVAEDSPAKNAKLLSNDQIVSVDEQKFSRLSDLTDYIRKMVGKEIVILVKREGGEQEIKVTPRLNPPVGQGSLGVKLLEQSQVNYTKIPFLLVPQKALEESLKLIGLMFSGLSDLIKNVWETKSIPRDVAGPVGILRLTNEVAKDGAWQVISFISLLSFNLGVINILPFPGLDGGRLLFIILEKIFGSRFSLKLQTFINTVGIAALLLFMALITYYDITRAF